MLVKRKHAGSGVRAGVSCAERTRTVATGPSRVGFHVAPHGYLLRNDRTCDLLRVTVFALAPVLGGLFMALSRTAVDYSWLAWIALLPLFFSIQAFRPPVAFLCGLVWGVSFFVCSAVVLKNDAPLTWRSFALLGAVPAIYTFVSACVTRHVGFNPLVLAFGWVGVEAALAPLGFRHGFLSAMQTDGTLLGFVSSMFGYVLVAFVVVFVNAVLADLLRRNRMSVAKLKGILASIRWQCVLLPQTRLHAAVFPRSSLVPRAPPIVGACGLIA